ncbi:exodeoxyribonuclease III [Oceanibacterium hippocampi]|uniref:Exodeoxyribonuclease III n=1 Tax=Oceanibacterium hippocampi TaxID=745714 RepID=A0A1Y5U2U7_9PROT|nr:exodeoxyribonuclease III [Oceanibacterium hippocampi]SLN77245.1 Exodeoxyribonuclease III [Oceanibacterium hippocampi]
MKIATWNVNSVKARLELLLDYLREEAPDVVCLQELKCQDAGFPALEIEDQGYNIAVHGQKSYNGVAILSKRPIEDVTRGLPGDDNDEQARYIEAVIDGVRVASIYLPNGNPVDSPKFPYKLAWLGRLEAHVQTLLAYEEPFVLAGDYNVIPQDIDCYDPELWAKDALGRPETRAAFRRILNLGLTEAFRTLHKRHDYTFWDYQRGAWERDNGLRIDHLLLSPQATDRLLACEIDKRPRAKPRPSDHTPIWCELSE